jgi:hypothetical protein
MPGAASFAATASHKATRLGIDPASDVAHAVAVLLADDQVSLPGAVAVGQVAVLIEHRGQPVSGLAQIFGFESTRQLGELGFGGFAGVVVDEAGQLIEELPNDAHVLGADRTTYLGRRGVRQHRLKWLASHRRPPAQVLGLFDAPIRLLAGDAQQRRQRRRRRWLTQLICGHLAQRPDHPMRHRRAAT